MDIMGTMVVAIIEDLDMGIMATTMVDIMVVKIGERAGKGLHRAYRGDPGPIEEGTSDALFEFFASFVIEKRRNYIVIVLGDNF
jgi:hypothetical protein